MVDKAVKKIRPSDYELSTVQDNLAQAIQQLLDAANGVTPQQLQLFPAMQMVRGPGTPQSVKTTALVVHGRPDGGYLVNQPTLQFGDPQTVSAKGVTTPQQDAQLFSYGQTVFFGSRVSPDGFVIIPQTAGPAFRLTNVGNTATLIQMSTEGGISATAMLAQTFSGNQFSGNTFSSVSGFKNVISCGSFWNSNYAANTVVQLAMAIVNSSNALGATNVGNTPFVMKFTHTTSIVGMSLNQAGPNTGTNLLLIYKNGALVFTWTAGAGGNNSTFFAAYPKNTTNLTFVAGDTLTTYYRNTTAANTQVTAHLTLEMAA